MSAIDGFSDPLVDKYDPSHQHIVIAVDGSPAAKEAGYSALTRNNQNTTTTFHFVTVYRRYPLMITDTFGPERVEEEKKRTKELNISKLHESELILSKFKTLCKKFEKDCRYSVIETSISGKKGIGKEICQYANTAKSNLVYLGSRDLPDSIKDTFGSVSNYLAKHCPTQLVIVNPRGNWHEWI